MPLTRLCRLPEHSFTVGKTLHFALIGFVSSLRAAFAALSLLLNGKMANGKIVSGNIVNDKFCHRVASGHQRAELLVELAEHRALLRVLRVARRVWLMGLFQRQSR